MTDTPVVPSEVAIQAACEVWVKEVCDINDCDREDMGRSIAAAYAVDVAPMIQKLREAVAAYDENIDRQWAAVHLRAALAAILDAKEGT